MPATTLRNENGSHHPALPHFAERLLLALPLKLPSHRRSRFVSSWDCSIGTIGEQELQHTRLLLSQRFTRLDPEAAAGGTERGQESDHQDND